MQAANSYFQKRAIGEIPKDHKENLNCIISLSLKYPISNENKLDLICLNKIYKHMTNKSLI